MMNSQDNDESWDTPNMRPSMESSGSSKPIIFPKQIFHGLASLLIISLCALLVELNSPGIASRISNRMGTLFWRDAQISSVAINNKQAHTVSSYYHPVPSPFISPKATSLVEKVPTSEPTHLTALYAAEGPTSEPTEFKDKLGSFLLNDKLDVPTSEPTEFRIKEEAFGVKTPGSDADESIPTDEPTIFNHVIQEPKTHHKEPTSEPTTFTQEKKKTEGDLLRDPTAEPTHGVQTREPTTFTGQTGEPTVYGQTGEPTVYGQSGEPTVYGQSGEPTVYGQSGEPTVFGKLNTAEPTIFMHDTLRDHDTAPTGEPTVFGMDHENEPHEYCSSSVACRGSAFCNYDEGDHGFCESCKEFETSTSCFTDGLPHKGAQECKDVCFHGHSTESKSSSEESNRKGANRNDPTPAPFVRTFAPTLEGSIMPTSDPTIFPTPEPTNAI